MPSNIERLGQTFHGQINSVGEAKARPVSELGKINGNFALVPDQSPGPIPDQEYSICGSARQGLFIGSRVLILWCGTEAVIVDVIN